MKIFTIDQIRSWLPCYDPAEFLPEGWSGTALDILRVEKCPIQDRLWVVLREDCISRRTLRLFACWCARQALSQVAEPDPRSVAAIAVAERYANGEASAAELATAESAAWKAWHAAAKAAEAEAVVAEAAAAAAVTARKAALGASDAARADQVQRLIEMLRD